MQIVICVDIEKDRENGGSLCEEGIPTNSKYLKLIIAPKGAGEEERGQRFEGVILISH